MHQSMYRSALVLTMAGACAGPRVPSTAATPCGPAGSAGAPASKPVVLAVWRASCFNRTGHVSSSGETPSHCNPRRLTPCGDSRCAVFTRVPTGVYLLRTSAIGFEGGRDSLSPAARRRHGPRAPSPRASPLRSRLSRGLYPAAPVVEVLASRAHHLTCAAATRDLRICECSAFASYLTRPQLSSGVRPRHTPPMSNSALYRTRTSLRRKIGRRLALARWAKSTLVPTVGGIIYLGHLSQWFGFAGIALVLFEVLPL